MGDGLAPITHTLRAELLARSSEEHTVDLTSLRNKSATLRIEFDGEVLTLSYNPHMYDDECQRILNNMTNEADNTSLGGIFERLITSWDLKDNGHELPVKYETFLTLPPFLRTKILNAIVEDEMERGKLRSSDNGSSAPAPVRRGLVPIGSSQSPTSNGQES